MCAGHEGRRFGALVLCGTLTLSLAPTSPSRDTRRSSADSTCSSHLIGSRLAGSSRWIKSRMEFVICSRQRFSFSLSARGKTPAAHQQQGDLNRTDRHYTNPEGLPPEKSHWNWSRWSGIGAVRSCRSPRTAFDGCLKGRRMLARCERATSDLKYLL